MNKSLDSKIPRNLHTTVFSGRNAACAIFSVQKKKNLQNRHTSSKYRTTRTILKEKKKKLRFQYFNHKL